MAPGNCYFILLALVIGGCAGYEAYTQERGASKRKCSTHGAEILQLGRELAQSRGCVGCHDIPGTHGPRGNVGPPLERRSPRGCTSAACC